MKVINKDDFFKSIDDLDIYSKDFKTITNLMNNLDDTLFVKILEEVINGNLYWSDFETAFNISGYNEVLRENIPNQNRLFLDISRLATLRESVGFNPSYSETNIGIIPVSFSKADDETLTGEIEEIIILLENIDGTDNIREIIKGMEVKGMKELLSNDIIVENNLVSLLSSIIQYVELKNSAEFYKKEYENYRDNLLFSLTKITPDDSILSQQCKHKLYNAIENGRMLSNCEIRGNDIYYNDNKIGEFGEEEGRSTILSDNSSFDYIDPDDVLLSIDQGIIPIGYSYQKIDDIDYEFMMAHNINESTLKQIKSLTQFLRREYFINR